MRNKNLVLTMIIAIAILLSSCAKSTDTGTEETKDNSAITTDKLAGQLIEPAQLISKAEAEELIGESMMEAEINENEAVGNKICFYESLDEDSPRFLQVSLTQQAFIPNNEITSKYLYESIRENFEEELTPVDGIGDEAFIAPPGIHILKGDYYIVIGVGNSDIETNRAILKAAGEKAVYNLETLIND